MNLGELTATGVLHLETFLLTLVRFGGMLALAPVLGHRSIPVSDRAALGVLFALLLTPVLGPSREVDLADAASLALAAAGELLVGLVIGFVATLALAAVESAGELIGTAMGFGFTTLFDPVQAAQKTAIDRLLSLVAVLLFLALNGHHLLIQAVASSFQRIPPGTVTLRPGGLAGGISVLGGKLFRSGLELAAPLLALLLVLNIGLALLNRVAPQTHVFAVGLPLTVGLGLVGLVEMLPYLGASVGRMTAALATDLDRLLGGALHGVR
jgi:flagellar biosynthetic protein FliR